MGYRVHAVFIHQGQANYGHYWIYIYNHQQEQWWKYNDSRVTKVTKKPNVIIIMDVLSRQIKEVNFETNLYF